MDKSRMAGIIRKTLFQQMATIKLDARRGDIKIASRASEAPRTFNYYFYVRHDKWDMTDNFENARFQLRLSKALRQATRSSYDFAVRPSTGPKGSFALEVSKPPTMWLKLKVSDLPHGKDLEIPVGVDLANRPIRIDYAHPITPHSMMAGVPGSGKSNNKNYLIFCLAKQNTPDEVKFLFIDVGKAGKDFLPVANLEHLGHPLITDPVEAGQVLDWLLAEKQRRDQIPNPLPHLFVFIDEATSLMEKNTPAAATLATLIREARASNIHIITVFHNPTLANVVNRDIPVLSALRLVGKTGDSIATKVALGQGGSGAERLTGSGDILCLNPAVSDEPKRVLTPLMIEGDYKVLKRGAQPSIITDLPAVTRSGPGRPQDCITAQEYARFLAEIGRGLRTGKRPPTPEWIGKKEEPMLAPSKSKRAWQGAVIITRELKKRGYTIR